MKAAQMGCVATSAVDEATDVNRSEGIHVAKWAASSTPPAADSTHWRLVSDRSSPARRHSVKGPVKSAPRKVRQKAMAKAGAAVAAMIGAEVEMKNTATASSPSRGAVVVTRAR